MGVYRALQDMGIMEQLDGISHMVERCLRFASRGVLRGWWGAEGASWAGWVAAVSC